MLSDSVTVWWMGISHQKGRAMLKQKLRVLFGDLEGAVELARKGITSRIASKLVLPKCVSRACFQWIVGKTKGDILVSNTPYF